MKLTEQVYIPKLSRKIRQYIKHCSACELNQTRRHSTYEELIPIASPRLPLQNHSHGFPTGTSWWIRHIPDCDLQNIKASNHLSQENPHEKHQNEPETLLNRLLIAEWGIPEGIYLRSRPYIHVRISDHLIQEIGNQVTHVDGITITLGSTVKSETNESDRRDRNFDSFITEKPRVRLN
jgi:hypothetical protein